MIIDTHTHFYDPTRPQGVPWPNPENALLYRRVMPEDFRKLPGAEEVTSTVVVEASPWVEDNQWILDLAEQEHCIVGFVGNIDPDDDEFPEHLSRFSASRLFSGIRVHLAATPQEPPDERMLRHLKLLAEADLELDILCGSGALPLVAALAEATPELRTVINHVAGVRIDGQTPDASWVAGMECAAAHPNVHCKASGLVEGTGQDPAPRDLDFYRPTLDMLWQFFGEDRLIYGSNWPVSERNGAYADVLGIVQEYFGEKGDAALDKVLARNAERVYRTAKRDE